MVSERCSLLSPHPLILGRQRPLCLTQPLPCWNQRGGCPQTWLLVSRKGQRRQRPWLLPPEAREPAA